MRVLSELKSLAIVCFRVGSRRGEKFPLVEVNRNAIEGHLFGFKREPGSTEISLVPSRLHDIISTKSLETVPPAETAKVSKTDVSVISTDSYVITMSTGASSCGSFLEAVLTYKDQTGKIKVHLSSSKIPDGYERESALDRATMQLCQGLAVVLDEWVNAGAIFAKYLATDQKVHEIENLSAVS